MATPLLEARDISKRFGRLQALDRVSIALPRGRTLALVGDNGAGKSTLIKILAGLHQPDSGEIWFEHRRVRLESPTAARKMGIETVYQDLALVENMSIARNFFLGAEPSRRVGPVSVLDTAKMHLTAESYLREIGITSLTTAEKEIRLLSGGERQAISIARAMYFGAKVMILDEPTSQLSIKEARKVLDYVHDVNAQGLSTIFITHNLSHVYPVADIIVVLYHGRKVGEFLKGAADPDVIESLIVNGDADLADRVGGH
ncbi:MAG: sugar ABC transporter ATP-binding protein [Bacillati bacterium ANGP1]|uniref:Sugar ABC transporter ATP-binding protein n=2 Tax=Candidatus Segetimicrobium genomatis TaxID=2569760 RepID=A0A537LQS3_9BACT|nr:MAG: sugar ABC transporter ATP-binding protein [Terrabacteria group bacterium ANGP1]